MNKVTSKCELDCKMGPVATQTVVPVADSHFVNGVCVPDASKPADTCKLDTDCTGDNKFCNVGAGVCTLTKDATNKACTTVAAGKSVTLGGECVADCTDLADATKTVNAGGYHEEAKVCTADTPKPATGNSACMPVLAGSSVNMTKQTCDMNCATDVEGSHMMNKVCVEDSAMPNKPCTTVTAGSSLSSKSDNCLPDCKDATDDTKTVNVPGYHDVDGTCTADSGVVWKGTSMAALVLALVMYM